MISYIIDIDTEYGSGAIKERTTIGWFKFANIKAYTYSFKVMVF